MVRTLDPEKSDIALIILDRLKRVFGMGSEPLGSLSVSESKEIIGKILKSKEYEQITKRSMDVKIRFKGDCQEGMLSSGKFKNFQNFHSFTNLEKNEIVLCYKNIKHKVELKMALDRELGLINLMPEIEKKFKEKKEEITIDKRFALASFISCRRSLRPFFSEKNQDGPESLLTKNAKICSTYYSKVIFLSILF